MGKKRHHVHVGRSGVHSEEMDAVPDASTPPLELEKTSAQPPVEDAIANGLTPPRPSSDSGERRASGETPEEASATRTSTKAEVGKAESPALVDPLQGGSGSSGLSTVEEVPLVPSGAESPLPLAPSDAEPALDPTARPNEAVASADSEEEEEEALREGVCKPPEVEPSALFEITQVLVFRISVALVALTIRVLRYVVSRPLVVKGTNFIVAHPAFPRVRDAATRGLECSQERAKPLLARVKEVAPTKVAATVEFAKDVYAEAVRMLTQAAEPEGKTQ